MTPERWTEIQTLFEAALEHSPEERTPFLAAAAPDPTLRREVEALLAADEQAGPLDALQDDLEPLASGWRAAPSEERVGPYRLVRELGRGGMGTVWLAERAVDDANAQFEQQVALKLLPGPPSSEQIRRFLAERQVLARLQHRHIARLLEGGVTERGRPYFALEVVDGQPITTYCDQHDLDIEARLQLFLQVCDAVQYAHQNLVVHRDLKPSNILVTTNAEGQPSAKLLDFGIAKLLDGPRPSLGAVTQTGQRMMTPAYAAPEQVRGEAVTTATDVYALGVVLYELLAGQRPYEVTNLIPSQVERLICETMPARPSTVVLDADTETPRAASRPGRLTGDLDVIVMKALRKEPAARYDSAAQLRDDLARHLAALPISARPSTVGYRVRSFVRRHRLGVGAVALVVLALVLGLATTLWQAQRAANEAEAAQAARLVAEREARKAQQTTDFLLDVFRVADPTASLGDTITAREILDAGAARAHDELRSQPDLQASVLAVVGDVYANLGLFDRAQPLLQDVVRLRTDTLGRHHPDVADALGALAELERQRSRLDAADSLYATALRTPGLPGPLRARLLDQRGVATMDLGRYDEADSLFRQALTLWEATTPPDPLARATTALHHAALHNATGAFGPADSLYQVALRTREAQLGPDHPDVATARNGYATFLYNTGDYASADSLYRQVLDRRFAVFGPDHPDVANAMTNLATTLVSLGRYGEADSLYQRALESQIDRLGPEHIEVSYTLGNLAVLNYHRGDLEAAQARFRDVLRVQRTLFGETHVDVAFTRNNIAGVARAAGDVATAEREYRAAIRLFEATVGDAHPYTATALSSLASVLHDEERWAEATRAYRTALDAMDAAWPDGHPSRAVVQSRFGDLLTVRQQAVEAEPLLREALASQRAQFPEHDARTLTTQRRLADALIALALGDGDRTLLLAEADSLLEPVRTADLDDLRAEATRSTAALQQARIQGR
ncbi:MAG: serine/threonine-protein kinase [Bacteroidota bacterium]